MSHSTLLQPRTPARRLLSLGLQHVLVMYAGTVTVPLILASAMQLDNATTVMLVSASLFTSGLATLLQSLGIGRFGARMPLIQGCSFIVLAPLVLIGQQYGVPAVFGATIGAGVFTLLAAPLFSRLLVLFPPLVIGCVITIIGLSLIPAAAIWLGGGNPNAADFGSPPQLLLGTGTLIFTLLLYAFCRGLMRSLSILIGMAVGTLAALLVGMADVSAVAAAPWFGVSLPFAFGMPQFEPAPIFVLCLSMIVVMTETTGNVLLIGRLTGQEIAPRRLADTLRADGLSTVIGGCLNSFPYNAFSQNAGVLMLTRVYDRYVLAAAGVILVLLGVFPKLGAVVATIPRPVLGGVGLLMFGMTLSAGIQELKRVDFSNERNVLIVAISISVGTLPMAFPALFHALSSELQLLLGSGIFIGGATAVLLNLLLNRPAPEAQGGIQ